MRKLLILTLGAALLAGAPLAASAQGAQHNGPPGDRHDAPQADHRPGMGQPENHPGMSNQGMHQDRYGQWNMGWGHRPPAPPKHFRRHDNWYQHVHACSARYRSYNPRTDLYVLRRGVMVRCRL